MMLPLLDKISLCVPCDAYKLVLLLRLWIFVCLDINNCILKFYLFSGSAGSLLLHRLSLVAGSGGLSDGSGVLEHTGLVAP